MPRSPRLPSRGRLYDAADQTVCADCVVASRAIDRMRGLLGRKSLDPSEGLLITHTSSVHTFFMAFPIDVVFLDRALRVLAIAPDVPRSRVRWRPGARFVLELAAGAAAAAGLQKGSELSLRADDGAAAPHDATAG